ncbi:hypothetical protein FM996_02155 [Methylosinus sporium]|uniref:Uncharacterized protein n=1 Tax=Methylosinus sporium TaxID=428 RepID=A0A549T6V1_METSR|nr:SIR2 family protein [Methylosinus sporium]TRL37585.1 hypothetical protein FM996_02155 [Methylosinus sporium]
MIDSTTALAFSMYENKGVYALLIGSGVSRAAQIPTGWEITLDLVKRAAILQGIPDQPDWGKWHREQYGKEPSYSELLDQLSATPEERRSILHSYIEPTDEDFAEGRKVPTKAHQAIARLVQAGFVRVIITTNFDRLLENALRELGVEPTVIKSDDDLNGAVPLIHSRCFIIKVHGDYLDTRIRNTESELSAYSAEMNTLLDRIFDEHGLIVCGWSADWDPALKAAITRAPNRRYPLFWATRGEPTAAARDVIALRAGKEIPIEGADVFFEKLDRLVSIQADLQRPNPRSIELLVAGTKKYLAKPEYRIQLDELIGDEIRHAAQGIKGSAFNTNGPWSNERFLADVARYEAVSEPLARIFGVLGRWGTGSEFKTAAETIRQFGSVDVAGGLVILLGLRSYPSVLLFISYGIALIKADRYTDLFRLFAYDIRTRSEEPSYFVTNLFLGAWEGAEADAWKLFPGFENRRTALSDHLHDIFSVWCDDYLYSEAEFTPLFEEFELLGSLAYLTLTTDLETLESVAAKGDGWGSNFVWAPFGRISWHRETRERLFASLAREETSKVLLAAGFARGNPAYLSTALANLKRLFGKVSF